MLPRFYPILDTSRPIPLIEQAKAMLDGGATTIQIRHKGAWTREMLAGAEEVVKIVPAVIVNDRADIAAILGTGVHLGQTDLPPSDARPIVGEKIIGFSTHNRQQLEAASKEPVDYVAVGPIFPTGSKANPDPVVGLDTFRELRALTRRPLVAIGGITRANAIAVLEAGADSVAVIGDLYPEELTAHGLRKRIEEWNKLLKPLN